DTELLAVSIRPYYLPREFSHVITITTYIPPSANADAACELLHTCCGTASDKSFLKAFLLITGDFNHLPCLPLSTNFHQYVNCCTIRDNKTLDLLYANTAGAYSSSPLPPLGRSDHNLVRLLSVYTPMVKRQPPNKRRVKQWSEEARNALRDCFDTTDWEKPPCVPPGGYGVSQTTKPWVTPDLRALLLEKRRAFQSGDRDELRRRAEGP
ncbi:hypothetical protein L3Q82_023110, partial [Scortum barcoo]